MGTNPVRVVVGFLWVIGCFMDGLGEVWVALRPGS